MSQVYDVLIVGSGPAGWTAAIYAARANFRTVVVTGMQSGGPPGGQLMLTTLVENYPGFDEGILGPELMERMQRQALRFGVSTIEADVTRVDFSTRPFVVYTEDGFGEKKHEARAVIIATGASARWLGLPSEERLRGRGVSSCATCDGFFFRDQEVAVVGGGDTALEEAIYLTRHASKVTVIHRRDQLRASKILQERAKANPAIEWQLNKEVVEVLGDERVEGVRLRDTRTGEESVLPVSGLFIAIGHRPNTDPFRGQIALDPDGFIVTERNTQTSVPGVFAAGDVQDRRYRQAITAAASGAMAALDAEEYLTGERRIEWSEVKPEPAPAPAASYTTMAVIDSAPSPVTRTAENQSLGRRRKVVMYTTSWCPDCQAAKRFLARRGVEYLEVDIEKDPKAAEMIERWSGGYRTVPTFEIDGTIIVDFDREALEKALSGSTQ